MNEEYIKACKKFASDVHQTALSKGWWDQRNALEGAALAYGGQELLNFAKITNQLAALMLVVTELGEAAEGLRTGNKPDDKIPEFNSVEAELADARIRIDDLSCREGYEVEEAMVAKAEMNKSRPYKHGKLA